MLRRFILSALATIALLLAWAVFSSAPAGFAAPPQQQEGKKDQKEAKKEAKAQKPAKADPNTVIVTVTADRPVSAPFRLVGRVKDEPRLTRPVRVAAVPG